MTYFLFLTIANSLTIARTFDFLKLKSCLEQETLKQIKSNSSVKIGPLQKNVLEGKSISNVQIECDPKLVSP